MTEPYHIGDKPLPHHIGQRVEFSDSYGFKVNGSIKGVHHLNPVQYAILPDGLYSARDWLWVPHSRIALIEISKQ